MCTVSNDERQKPVEEENFMNRLLETMACEPSFRTVNSSQLKIELVEVTDHPNPYALALQQKQRRFFRCF
jgi:hypothetical protein